MGLVGEKVTPVLVALRFADAMSSAWAAIASGAARDTLEQMVRSSNAEVAA